MRKEIKNVYSYNTTCAYCDAKLNVFYTLADFGDAPFIRHCKHCGELYWYTPEDEDYIRPLEEQLDGIKCHGCYADLKQALVPTHKHIKCSKCENEFSLDDNFAGNIIPSNDEMVSIEVYVIYS